MDWDEWPREAVIERPRPHLVVVEQKPVTGEQPVSEDFGRLVGMANGLTVKYEDVSSEEWKSSQLGWIRHEVSSSHKRGKIGEEIVRAWAESEGLGVGGRGSRGHDCVIAGLKIEVKTSLRWNNDRFYFLNLRDFEYDAVAFLGLAPHDFGLWIAPKRVVMRHALIQQLGAADLSSQWLTFSTKQPPRWLRSWGGSFAAALEAFHRVPRFELAHEREEDEREAWAEMSSEVDVLGGGDVAGPSS